MDGRKAGTRWLIFNGVGLLGACVQLAVLGLLLAATGLHVLAATALAVEAALLHNLWWHERWTWGDRRSRGPAARLRRAVRFHLTNGVVSIAGNLMLMDVLSGSFGCDPVVANLVAIAACSYVNFAASERWVFRQPSWVPGGAPLS